MKIKEVKFLKSIPDHTFEPKPVRPTFVFMGRSNVGKSSLINMLVERKSMAKVSATPGKTQMINYFTINQAWYLVDVPGYGWARISQTKRTYWEKNLKDYLQKMEGLVAAFILLDARHAPQKKDIQFINAMGALGIPFSLLFTKIDKVTKSELAKQRSAFEETLKTDWAELPPFFFSSSRNKRGRDEILEYIESCLAAV